MAIIACILAILLVILSEAFPLFRGAAAVPVPAVSVALEGPPIAFLADEYREVVGIFTARGIRFASLKDGSIRKDWAWPVDPPGALAVVVSAPRGHDVAVAFKDGRVLPVRLVCQVIYDGGSRRVEPSVQANEPFAPIPGAPPPRLLASARPPAGPIIAAATGPRAVSILAAHETKALIGPPRREVIRRSIELDVKGDVTTLAMDGRGDDLFAGTSAGEIVWVDLRRTELKVVAIVSATGSPPAAVSALGFLLGDRTLVVGDASGGVGTWQVQAGEEGARRLDRLHAFEPQAGPVLFISESPRDKCFVTADAAGTLHLRHGTTARTVLTLRAPGPGLCAAAFAPKADAVLAVDAAGRISQWAIDNPHPEATLGSLFGKVWYEGYATPQHVWQSSGSTDDFEPKFSLIPLIFGTLKGTFYALLLAVPLAILGALYTAQFMHPRLKANVKPVVELMAGIPSVVLGMLAGLWLAPRVEKVVPGLFLMPLAIPLTFLGALGLWRLIPLRIRGRIHPGFEIVLFLPIALAGGAIALGLGEWIEMAMPSGDFREWIRLVVGLTYDQRNSLVVGIAMGFAVIPIVFTIAEDAIANVPPHLTAGSLALGATPWQTALHVVLPAASPAIFSAVMIGFGRAVGETMIMVMATGNTPILDVSPFNGFRALSANIAVELPEASQGGTLFRILFLTAFLLFVMTFLVNTAAEAVRLRLRRRFSLL
jgi:phosphate transport system permease protein